MPTGHTFHFAWMREKKMSKTEMAERISTSRVQIVQMLDLADGNVTIDTVQKAAAAVGRKLQLELV